MRVAKVKRMIGALYEDCEGHEWDKWEVYEV